MLRELRFSLAAVLLSASATAQTDVCFTPGGGCEAPIVAHIHAATKTIRVQAYSFTSGPIARALIDAQSRGVDVEVILDRSDVTGRGSKLGALVDAHVPTWIDSSHAISHNKVIIYDGTIVQTGSFNLTTSAERHNAENAVFLDDAETVAKFTANWERHRAHSAEVR